MPDARDYSPKVPDHLLDSVAVSLDFNGEQFHLLSYSNISFPVCTWIARYDRIVMEFTAWLVPGRMTLEDMENLAKKIDRGAGQIIIK